MGGDRIIGERFYIYASKARAARPIWSDDLRVATPDLRSAMKWMIELAGVKRIKTPRKPKGHPQPDWFNPLSREARVSRLISDVPSLRYNRGMSGKSEKFWQARIVEATDADPHSLYLKVSIHE